MAVCLILNGKHSCGADHCPEWDKIFKPATAMDTKNGATLLDRTIENYFVLIRSKLELVNHMRYSDALGTEENLDEAFDLLRENLVSLRKFIEQEKRLALVSKQ